jgi:hypothetical protein
MLFPVANYSSEQYCDRQSKIGRDGYAHSK